MKIYTGVCSYCEKEFSKTRPLRSDVCSRKCAKDKKYPPQFVNCLVCSKEFRLIYPKKKTSKTCSQSCNMKLQWQNVSFRFRMESILKNNIKECWLDPEFKIRQSKAASARLKVKWQDTSYREAKLESNKQHCINMWANSEFRKKFGRIKGYHSSSKVVGTLAQYRSSWELVVYKQLDNNSEVVFYQPEPFSVSYIYEGITRSYFPDLLITYKDNRKELVEIKPKCYLDFDINKCKFLAAIEYCNKNNIKFIVKTETEIFN